MEGPAQRPPRRSADDRGRFGPTVHRVFLSRHFLFWLLSLAYFWQPLLTDQLLVPTNPSRFAPWSEMDTQQPNDAIRSNPLMGDSLILTVPWRSYNSEMLLSGELPFWNPYIFCGYPHLAALQSNSLYPPVVAFDLWDPLAGLARSMALHLGLAGSLMFCFLRRLGLGIDAATLGAVVFEFNGFFLVRIGAPSYVFTGVWTPLLLLGIHEMATSRRWRPAWKVVAAVSMAFLGGHPQILAFMLMTGGTYLLFVLSTTPRLSGHSLFRHFFGPSARVGLATLLGLLVTGFQLLPFLEMMGETARGQAAFEPFAKIALPPVALLQAGLPDLFGHPADGDYWLHTITPLVDPAPSSPTVWGFNYCGENLFTGVLPLVLAAVAVFGLRSKISLFFGGILTTVILILLGTPAMRIFYLALPIFRFSRPDRVIFVAMVALSILAAIGYQGLIERVRLTRPQQGPRWVPWLFAASLAGAVAWPIWVDPGIDGGYGALFSSLMEHLAPQARQIVIQGAFAAAVAVAAIVVPFLIARRPSVRAGGLTIMLALTIWPLFSFGWKFNPSQPRPLFAEADSLVRLAEVTGPMGRIARLDGVRVLPPNMGQVFGFFDVNGSSAAGLQAYVDLISSADSRAIRKQKYFRSLTDRSLLDGHLLDLLGVRVILSSRRLPRQQIETPTPGFQAYERTGSSERFHFVEEIESYENVRLATRRLLAPDFDPSTTALVHVDSPAAMLPRERSAPDSAPGVVRLISFTAHEITLDVTTERLRLLVSSEVDYPGWITTIDQNRVPTVLVNTAFRGVVVPPGRHRVVFRYIPRSFIVGCVVSLIGCLLLALSMLRCRGENEPVTVEKEDLESDGSGG
jgi:hypothetical protein